MSAKIDKPWITLTLNTVARIPAQLGVYEIADQYQKVLLVSYAGGNSKFGLQSLLLSEARTREKGFLFRYEINMQYHSRWQELLMLHFADNNVLPQENHSFRPRVLGRLTPG